MSNANLPDISQYNHGEVIRILEDQIANSNDSILDERSFSWEYYRVKTMGLNAQYWKVWEKFTPNPSISAYMAEGN